MNKPLFQWEACAAGEEFFHLTWPAATSFATARICNVSASSASIDKNISQTTDRLGLSAGLAENKSRIALENQVGNICLRCLVVMLQRARQIILSFPTRRRCLFRTIALV